MELEELEHYLKTRHNTFVTFSFNPLEGTFIAEVQKTHLTGFETVTSCRGYTLNDCLSTLDTTLLAERGRK